MKNSKLRRVLMLVACAVLLVSLSVGATLAYLTATTKTVTNTFTVGNVSFDESLNGGLDEAKVNVYGEPLDANGKTEAELADEDPTATFTPATRVLVNSYKLIPGHEYTKDPTVHLAAGSENCYVFVYINKTDLLYTATGATTATDIEAASVTGGYQNIAAQITANGWTDMTPAGHTAGKLFVYNSTVNTLDGNNKDLKIFEKFMLADDAVLPNSTEAAQLQIKITAYAIQADGFANAQAAWDNSGFTLQFPTT